MKRIAVALALGVAVACLSGCGKRTHDVQGKVTYNGAPLARAGGQIVFVGPDNSQTIAAIGQDGTYRAEKVPAGSNRVAVYYPNPDAQKGRQFPTKPRPGQPPAPPPQNNAKAPFLTPSRYASPDTSGYAVQVGSGTVFNADMTGPKVP